MHEIFISYSSKHRDLTRQLVAVLEEQYGADSVWWDHELEARASYATQIRAALEQSRVVVVIWTADAMVSDYVYAEAVRALASGKLVNVRPRDMSFRDIPEPFNIHHIDEAEDYARILTTVAKVWNGTPIPTRVPLHETYFRQHGRRLLDPKLEPLPPNAGPVVLLQAKYAVVPYADVTGTAAELVAWCADDPRPNSGRLIHGPGGLGKTRLMIDVAAQLRGRGWMAGFLDRPDDLDDPTRRQRWQALEQLIDHGDDAGVLLVLDYVEGRQSELVDLGRRLAKRPGPAARPIRMILLARSAGEWWERLVTEQPELDGLVASAVDASAVVPLSVIPQPAQRTALFDAAAIAFAERGWPRPSAGPPPELRARIAVGEDFERPLAVQMAALLWLASAEPAAGSAGIDKLLDRILGLERAHWVKLLGVLSEDQLRDLSRGIGQVTLVQGVESIATAERLLMGDTFYGAAPRARVAIDPVLRALCRLYGRAEGIGAIEPDLVGEHHVAGERVGDADLLAGCLDWIAAQPEERRARYRRDLLTVLQRATHRVHGSETVGRAEAMLDSILTLHAATFASELIGVMIETPGNLAQLLIRKIAELNGDVLSTINAHLPRRSLLLMELSLQVADRLTGLARTLVAVVDEAPDATAELHESALAHYTACIGTLGFRLANLGRREEALAATQEAVNIRRQLATARPDAFLPDLATSLNNLGEYLSDLGRQEEALAASQEAVGIRRQLAAARPDAFLSGLATSLNNLGIRLSDLGRCEEALTVSQEAVGIQRQLAVERPDAFLPYLATYLSNLGVDFSNLGRQVEALAVYQEAVGIQRQLAAAQPDAFLPDLVSTLNNLGIRLFSLGRLEEALAASQEAVNLYRELAAAQPGAFFAHLAKSFGPLARTLARLDRPTEAAEAAGEGLSIVASLVERHPATFRHLAAGLRSELIVHSEMAAIEPDKALLERVARALGEEVDS